MNDDSSLFMHLNFLRDNLIPMRDVFQTNYFENSYLLYDITPMQILRKIYCLRNILQCIAVTVAAPYDAL